jgi:hypothetical protein
MTLALQHQAAMMLTCSSPLMRFVTFSSSHVTPHLKAMQTTPLELPSRTCTLMCCFQQSLQKVWLQSMVVQSSAGHSVKHVSQVTQDFLAFFETPVQGNAFLGSNRM